MRETVPILMYHSIAEQVRAALQPFCVTPSEFGRQMEHLRAEGYTTLTVRDLVARRIDRATLPERPVVLTFDDGFADFHDEVLPVLQRCGATATLYVTTGYVGRSSQWLAGVGEGDRPMLTWAQIRACADAGIEIGAHSVAHAALDRLPTRAATDEIVRSKLRLEEEIDRTVATFAYPFGYYDARVRDLVMTAGYTAACAVNYRYSSPDEDPFLLSRMIVRRGCPLSSFARIASGRPPLVVQSYDRARSTVWRSVRHFVGGPAS